MEVPPEREKELKEWERLNKRRAKKLLERPKLLTYQKALFNDFLCLSKRRQFSMSELPLSVEAITCYAYEFGYRKDFRFFFHCISEMDDEFLKFQAERREAERENKTKDRPQPKKPGSRST